MTPASESSSALTITMNRIVVSPSVLVVSEPAEPPLLTLTTIGGREIDMALSFFFPGVGSREPGARGVSFQTRRPIGRAEPIRGEARMPARSRTPRRSAEQIVGAAAASLGDAPDLAAVLKGIAAAACTALGADRATCYAYDVETGGVSAVYTTENDPKRRAFLERTVGMGAAQLPIWSLQLAQSDPLLVVEDAGNDPTVPAALAARLGSGAFLGVRLEHLSVRSGESPALLGTLFCSYTAPRRFSETERQAARGLAAVATLALANARLQAETVLGLAAASAASEIIQRQRDYSEALVASMQDGLTVLSPEGRLTEVSPSFCRLTGFAREDLIGRGCSVPLLAGVQSRGHRARSPSHP